MDDPDDGVKRDQLDYRAGFVEGLGQLLALLELHHMRATTKEAKGLAKAYDLAKVLRDGMVSKMKSGSTATN